MIDIRAWAEYVVEWAAKDPYGFLTTVILALTPLFIASALLSWKLAKMIETRDREQKKKQKRQENIAKSKRVKKDWGCGNIRVRSGRWDHHSLLIVKTQCPVCPSTRPLLLRDWERDTASAASQCWEVLYCPQEVCPNGTSQQEHSGRLYDGVHCYCAAAVIHCIPLLALLL